MNRSHRFMAILLLAGLPALAHAGDAALYGPEAPAGSAFVRVFNATPGTVSDATVADKSLQAVEQFEASKYVFVPSGEHTLRAGGDQATVQAAAGRYYTATLTAEGLKLHELTPPDDRLKALVVLYNLTDRGALQLKTQDGGSTIAEATSAGVATREVNAVRVPMAVFEGDRKLVDSRAIDLKRGKAFSVFVTAGQSGPRLTWIVD